MPDKKKDTTLIKQIKRELESERRKNKDLIKELNTLRELYNEKNNVFLSGCNSVDDCTENASKNDDLNDDAVNAIPKDSLLDYRRCFYKYSKRFLRLCLSMQNWADKQLEQAKLLLKDDNLAKFNNNFNDFTTLIDGLLEEYEIFKPGRNAPYNFDEHDVENRIDDSEGFYVHDVISPGYKLDGKIIRKAKVVVRKKKGR